MLHRIALLTALLITAAPALLYAHEYEAGGLSIFHPYAYEVSLKGEPTHAYMTITNNGDEKDVLLSASSPIATSIDIIDNEEKMDKVEIASHEAVKFKMKGIHLRLNGVKKAIKPGAKHPITLTFAHAGAVKGQLLITKLGEVSLCDDGHHNKKIGSDKRN